MQDKGIAFSVLGDEDDVDAHLDVVPASLAKGLEFDHVVLVEPAGIVAGEADERTGLRRLYVCLTRAVTSLAVLHSEDLPDGARTRASRLTGATSAATNLRRSTGCGRTRSCDGASHWTSRCRRPSRCRTTPTSCSLTEPDVRAPAG